MVIQIFIYSHDHTVFSSRKSWFNAFPISNSRPSLQLARKKFGSEMSVFLPFHMRWLEWGEPVAYKLDLQMDSVHKLVGGLCCLLLNDSNWWSIPQLKNHTSAVLLKPQYQVWDWHIFMIHLNIISAHYISLKSDNQFIYDVPWNAQHNCLY